MKSFEVVLAASSLTALVAAQVTQPTVADAWRVVPIMPGCYLEKSTKYSLYTNGANNYITFQGKFDNGGKSPIESDGVVGVARGFFLQDMTYGFDSLDGFVVWYKGQKEDPKWGQSSLKITKKQYDSSVVNLDLTNTTNWPTDNNWTCEVTLDTNASPEYEQLYCSRKVATSNRFSTLEIKYQSRVVVNAIGYLYKGSQSGASEWVIGGQVTLDLVGGASSLAMMGATLVALYAF